MSRKQEEEDLALALALSNSIAWQEQEQEKAQQSHRQPCSNPISDPQSLAFFTDIPINHNTNGNSNHNHNHSFEGQKQSTFDDDVAYACRLQTEEDARKRAEDKKQFSKDSQLAKDLYDNEQRLLMNHDAPKADAKMDAVKVSNYTVNNRNSNACSYCKKSLFGPYKVVETQLKLHPQCFLCSGCGQPIENNYAKTGSLVTNNIEFYHTNCSVELFSLDCDLCGNKLRGRYHTHGFFTDKQKFCTSHNVQTEHRCCTSCNLIEPKHTTNKSTSSGSNGNSGSGSGSGVLFHTLPDGRAICPECVSFIILESSEAKDLYLEAVNFMEHELGLLIPAYMREVPVVAVDLASLNDQSALNRHICTAHPPVQLPSSGGNGGDSTGTNHSISTCK